MVHFNFDNLNRQQRRALARKNKKQPTPKQKVITTNEAFNSIKSELIGFGWQLDADFINIVDNRGEISITSSEALRLPTQVFNVTLIPHENGIEISRLEVFPEFQEQGYGRKFLDNLLIYLNSKGVSEIYAIPFPAGLEPFKEGPCIDDIGLQRFFQKSGFKPHQNDEYWEFNANYLNKLSIAEFDVTLLSREFSINNDQRISGDLFLLFDFTDNKEKNFMADLQYMSYSKIRRITKSFLDDELVGDNQLKTLHCLIEESLVKSEANEFNSALADTIKKHFAKYLFDTVGDFSDKYRVANLIAILVGLLQLGDKGFENCIDTYIVRIDEFNKHLKIDSATKIDGTEQPDIFLSKN